MAERFVEPPVGDSVIDVFLCHATKDKPWVRRLAEQIESETFDGQSDGRPLRVFLDEWDIDTGEDFVERINLALQSARFVAVALSPNLLSAGFAPAEWHHVFAADPMNRSGRLIPLFYRDYDHLSGRRIDLPAPFRVLKWVDFRTDRSFNRSFQQLVRRIRELPPRRGQRRAPLASLPRPAAPMTDFGSSADPDPIDEAILGNLLPVRGFPTSVWTAQTSARTAAEILDRVPDPPIFELRSKHLWTFFDLRNASEDLAQVLDPHSIRTEQLAGARTDPDRWRFIVALLNRCVEKYLLSMPIRLESRRKHLFYFLPERDGSDRRWRNGRDAVRTVAARKLRPSMDTYFWVHHAAQLSIQSIGDGLYLLVEPHWGFSPDGRRLSHASWVSSLHRGWTGRERNAAILRSIVFWARTLSKGRGQIRIPTGGVPLVLSGIPALARTHYGIETDTLTLRSLLRHDPNELDEAAANAEVMDDCDETGNA